MGIGNIKGNVSELSFLVNKNHKKSVSLNRFTFSKNVVAINNDLLGPPRWGHNGAKCLAEESMHFLKWREQGGVAMHLFPAK